MKIRALLLGLLFICLSFLVWAQEEPKFVARPTEEDFKILGLNGPRDIEVDNTGMIYVAVGNTKTVNIYKPDGTLETKIGHEVTLENDDDPAGIADIIMSIGLDKDQNIYVCEGNKVKVFNRLGEPLLNIKMPDYLMSITDDTGRRVYKPTSPPEAKNLPGAKSYATSSAQDAAISSNGNIYVADGSGHSVVVFDYEGNVLTVFENVMVNNVLTHYYGPQQLAFNSKGELYIIETLQCVCIVTDAKGNYLRHFGKPGNVVGSFQRLTGIAIDDLDRVYCADFVIGSVQVFDDQGNFLHVLTDKNGAQWDVGSLLGLAVDPKRVYLAEPMMNRIQARKFVK